MTLGYSCDAENCDELQDEAFVTVSLNLDSLPTVQGLTIALNLHQKNIIELDDHVYINAMRAAKGEAQFEHDLPSAELHLCPSHALTALSAVGTVNVNESPSEAVQEALDEDEQV